VQLNESGPSGCTVVHGVDEAIAAAGGAEEAMVIGGGELYRQVLERAGRMYLTLIDHAYPGDTRFPDFDAAEWHEVAREDHAAGDGCEHAYSFVTLERSHPASPAR